MSLGWSHRGRERARGRRGLSTVVSVIVLVVVLALVGVTSYGLLGSFGNKGVTFTCQPANSAACGVYQNTHDVSLLVPFESAA